MDDSPPLTVFLRDTTSYAVRASKQHLVSVRFMDKTSHLMICDTCFKQTTQTQSITPLVLLFLHAQ